MVNRYDNFKYDLFGHKLLLSIKEKIQIPVYKILNLNIFRYLFTKLFVLRKYILPVKMALTI